MKLRLLPSRASYPETHGFLDEDESSLIWEDPDPGWEHLLTIIGKAAMQDTHRKPIRVKNLDRLKHVAVRVGEFPRTLQGALDRQRFRRKMHRKRAFIPEKIRLDAHR